MLIIEHYGNLYYVGMSKAYAIWVYSDSGRGTYSRTSLAKLFRNIRNGWPPPIANARMSKLPTDVRDYTPMLADSVMSGMIAYFNTFEVRKEDGNFIIKIASDRDRCEYGNHTCECSYAPSVMTLKARRCDGVRTRVLCMKCGKTTSAFLSIEEASKHWQEGKVKIIDDIPKQRVPLSRLFE